MQTRPLSVVMPAYNEQATIAEAIERILRLDCLRELIVVDDHSSDNTSSIVTGIAARDSRVRLIRHDRNQGKTAGLNTGIAETVGEIVVIQDADLEYSPVDIPELIAPIIDGDAAVVLGSRFLVRRRARVLYFTHYVANRALTLLSNCFTNLNMTDLETCYKAFRGDIIRNMTITSSRFGFEVESVAKAAKLGLPVYEVPISYHGRTYEDGKKIGWSDGVAAIWYIVKYNALTTRKASFHANPALSLEAGDVSKLSKATAKSSQGS